MIIEIKLHIYNDTFAQSTSNALSVCLYGAYLGNAKKPSKAEREMRELLLMVPAKSIR